jgi:hypothetical protein
VSWLLASSGFGLAWIGIYISRRRRRVDLGAGSGRLLVVYT